MTGDFAKGEFPPDTVDVVWVRIRQRVPGGWERWSKSHAAWRDEWDDYGDSCDLYGPWEIRP